MKSHPRERIFSHIFREKRFAVLWRRVLPLSAGSCDHPTSAGKKFALDLHCEETKTDEKLLAVVLEECIHANHPDLDDDAVREGAIDSARFLFRMGFAWAFDRKKRKRF